MLMMRLAAILTCVRVRQVIPLITENAAPHVWGLATTAPIM